MIQAPGHLSILGTSFSKMLIVILSFLYFGLHRLLANSFVKFDSTDTAHKIIDEAMVRLDLEL